MLISGGTPCCSRIRSVQQSDAWVFRPSGQRRATVEQARDCKARHLYRPRYMVLSAPASAAATVGVAGPSAGGGGAEGQTLALIAHDLGVGEATLWRALQG